MGWKSRTSCSVIVLGVLLTSHLVGCSKSEETHGGVAAASKADPLALPTSGALTTQNLVAYLRARLTFRRADEFSPDFDDSALKNRSFKAVVPVTSGDTSDGAGHFYTYDLPSKRLRIVVMHSAIEDTSGNFSDYAALDIEKVDSAPVGMSNAFGGTKTITPQDRYIFGLRGPGNHLPLFPRGRYGETQSVEVVVEMPPEQARAAVRGLELIFEGTIQGAAPLSACYVSHDPPEFDAIYDITWHECVVSVDLRKITVQSPSAGVLKVLSAENP